MLDPNLFRDDIAELKKRYRTRNVDADALSRLGALSPQRRELVGQVEALKSKRNASSKEVGMLKAKSRENTDEGRKAGERADQIMKETKEIGDQIKVLDDKLALLESQLADLAMGLPNLPDASVPDGAGAEGNQEVRKWGTPKTFSFKPKEHTDLGEGLGILDFERASKLSGARFSIYLGAGAALERALIQFMLDLHTRKHGYKEVIPPFMVNRATMTGTGQLPKFEADLFKTGVSDRELFLIPTSEVPLTNIYADEIIEPGKLPYFMTAYSPCFRSEAGSYGKDTKGLIRQHQFQKVELVKLVEPEKSFDELEAMTANAEKVLQLLELPYRTVCLCTGDMGFSATKTYDIEVWLPGQNAYREISSCSNCGDFQARRAKIRFKRDAKGKTEFVHTLNGSGLAVGRTFIAILENFQNEKGEVQIPKVLHSYLQGAPGFVQVGTELWMKKV